MTNEPASIGAPERVDALSYDVEDISWDRVNPDGTKFALLQGTRSQGELFTYAFFIPAGVWDPPHYHTGASRVVVARGELQLGYGREMMKEEADRFATGSFLFVPARAAHFDGADLDTVIIGTSSGSWDTTYV